MLPCAHATPCDVAPDAVGRQCADPVVATPEIPSNLAIKCLQMRLEECADAGRRWSNPVSNALS